MDSTPLGIDIAKKKFDAVILVENKVLHKEFTNDEKGFNNLLSWLKEKGSSQVHACLEATGVYSEDLANFLYENDLLISVVNPMRIKAFANSELKRNKTDKADAETIARFCKIHKPLLWKPPLPEWRHLRVLYRCLKALQDDKTRIYLRLEKIGNKESADRPIWESLLASLEREILNVHKNIDQLLNLHQSIKDKVMLLSSIPGISKITSLALMSEIPDVMSFSSARELAAYAGLSPKHRVSGSSVKGKTRLSKMGNPVLRKALYMPAVVAKNHNPILKKFADRLLDNHKHPMAIIAAVMRKLLHIVYGVLKSGKPFDASYSP